MSRAAPPGRPLYIYIYGIGSLSALRRAHPCALRELPACYRLGQSPALHASAARPSRAKVGPTRALGVTLVVLPCGVLYVLAVWRSGCHYATIACRVSLGLRGVALALLCSIVLSVPLSAVRCACALWLCARYAMCDVRCTAPGGAPRVLRPRLPRRHLCPRARGGDRSRTRQSPEVRQRRSAGAVEGSPRFFYTEKLKEPLLHLTLIAITAMAVGFLDPIILLFLFL